MPVLNANSVDPDQTPLSAASDLGLHCLPMSHLLVWDARHKWVKQWDFFIEKKNQLFPLDYVSAQTTISIQRLILPKGIINAKCILSTASRMTGHCSLMDHRSCFRTPIMLFDMHLHLSY